MFWSLPRISMLPRVPAKIQRRLRFSPVHLSDVSVLLKASSRPKESRGQCLPPPPRQSGAPPLLKNTAASENKKKWVSYGESRLEATANSARRRWGPRQKGGDGPIWELSAWSIHNIPSTGTHRRPVFQEAALIRRWEFPVAPYNVKVAQTWYG